MPHHLRPAAFGPVDLSAFGGRFSRAGGTGEPLSSLAARTSDLSADTSGSPAWASSLVRAFLLGVLGRKEKRPLVPPGSTWTGCQQIGDSSVADRAFGLASHPAPPNATRDAFMSASLTISASSACSDQQRRLVVRDLHPLDRLRVRCQGPLRARAGSQEATGAVPPRHGINIPGIKVQARIAMETSACSVSTSS